MGFGGRNRINGFGPTGLDGWNWTGGIGRTESDGLVKVYTRVGPVLMSINPYKWILGLYSEEAMLSYHGKAAMVEAGELAPHLFGVADHAYSQLVSSMWKSGI